jgi:stearoyl-CoA desaturase (Delta-9 desaturase)
LLQKRRGPGKDDRRLTWGRVGTRYLPIPMAIALFFVGHWTLSVFSQTFFQHRYGAHRMFTMSKGWERFFYLFAYVTQGSSFLVPRGYAVLHRMHHAFSDTPKDPHSPSNHSGFLSMMSATRKTYHDLAHGLVQPEARFDKGYPEWPAIDKFSQSWVARIGWIAAYTLFYVAFATQPWHYALLPFHYLMGPVHGAIVNWCGHRYGYKSFNNGDDSRNSLFIDFVTLGELFQNNHHRFGMSPNFAARWFELDPCYQVIKVLAFFRVIKLADNHQVARYEPEPIAAE